MSVSRMKRKLSFAGLAALVSLLILRCVSESLPVRSYINGSGNPPAYLHSWSIRILIHQSFSLATVVAPFHELQCRIPPVCLPPIATAYPQASVTKTNRIAHRSATSSPSHIHPLDIHQQRLLVLPSISALPHRHWLRGGLRYHPISKMSCALHVPVSYKTLSRQGSSMKSR